MILFLILGWGASLIKVFKSSYNYYETLVFVHGNVEGVWQQEFEKLAIFQDTQEQVRLREDHSPYWPVTSDSSFISLVSTTHCIVCILGLINLFIQELSYYEV